MTEPKKRSIKKKWLVLSFFIFASIAGYFFYGRSFQKPEDVKMGKNAVFVSKDPILNFTFEYSQKEWLPRESQGRKEKYSAVYLKGPFDPEKKFITLIEVVVKSLEPGKTASDLLDAFLKRVSDWPKFKVIHKKTMDIEGEKAFSVIFESKVLLPIESLDAKPMMVEEQVIFMVKNNRSYRFSFHTLADRWKDYLPAFERVLKTFKFKK